jgi:hypothetical protein
LGWTATHYPVAAKLFLLTSPFIERDSWKVAFEGTATFRETVPAQPVDATPSAINLSSKGGVYDA